MVCELFVSELHHRRVDHKAVSLQQDGATAHTFK